jgi:hypothetical protein
MTCAHRMVLCLISPDDTPKEEVAAIVSRLGDLYPVVVQHDVRAVDWHEELVLLSAMTPEQFEAWFASKRPAAPTVQTIVSMIRIAPRDAEGRGFLVDDVLPLLEMGHLSTALARTSRWNPRWSLLGSRRRGNGGAVDGVDRLPLLVRMMFDAFNAVIMMCDAVNTDRRPLLVRMVADAIKAVIDEQERAQGRDLQTASEACGN